MVKFVSIALVCIFACSAMAEKITDEKAFLKKIAMSSEEQTLKKVEYDGAYVKIAYPNGDVAANKGVCTDVVIRAYRANGYDLQKLVHEDRKAHSQKTDTNIDHRRVRNLMEFFKRHGEVLPVTKNAADFQPGEIVTWNVGAKKNLPHIGIVSEKKSLGGKRHLITHNIGNGPQTEDMLFDYEMTGHFKFVPKS